MRLFGVVVLLTVMGLAGAPVMAPASAAPANTAGSKVSKASVKASSRPAVKTTKKASAKKSAGKPASARKAAQRPHKATRQALAAQASVRRTRAKGKQPTASLSGSGAVAVPASLQSLPAGGGTPSIGEAIGLHRVSDPLALRSAVALVVDAGTGDILYEKNSRAVLPIASITKVMMAMVVLDARQAPEEVLVIDDADRDTERLSASRLPVGTRLTRTELLQLALMSSENRAASALARHYPGGLSAFVTAANQKAAQIGMQDSVFADGTGLSSSNVSTARDLAVMVAYASRYPLIREYSTAQNLSVRTVRGARVFRTTNRMVVNPDWNLSLQKTGYISESGNCLVVRGEVDGRSLILVLLDSYGKYSRLGDAQRIRRWLEG